MRAQVVPKEPDDVAASQPTEREANGAHRPHCPSWTRLEKRVFDLDLEHCPNCGGEMTIIAATLEVDSDIKSPVCQADLGLQSGPDSAYQRRFRQHGWLRKPHEHQRAPE